MNKIEEEILSGEAMNDSRQELFIVKTANQCLKDASTKPIPKMLWSELWHEGELCILFADTNTGKSILAVMIADMISRGQSKGIFKVESMPVVVLYLDFELSDKQFEKRYSEDYRNHYPFHNNLYRVEINPDYDGTSDFESELEQSIERRILEIGAKVLIVDNITFLKTQSTDTAKEALPLMNMLIKLKKKYSISILALAHTPKRDHYKPISVNDLAGSKHLANFADSIFAIGQSHKDNSLRYIKQIKARATEKIYDSDYVIVCKVEKQSNFLTFEHVTCEHEREHLKELTKAELDEMDKLIIELRAAEPELSENAIAVRLGTNHKRVDRVLKRNGLK